MMNGWNNPLLQQEEEEGPPSHSTLCCLHNSSMGFAKKRMRQRKQSRGGAFQCHFFRLLPFLLYMANADELRSRGFASTTTTSTTTIASPVTTSSKYTTLATAEEQSFMQWCNDFLGIHTVLEIAHFTYDSAVLQVNTSSRLEDDLVDAIHKSSSLSNETVLIRGLAAKEDIHPGDIVIRIPLNALIIRDTLGDLAKFILQESNETIPLYRQIILDRAERHNFQWIFDTDILSVQSETFRSVARNLRDEINILYNDWKMEDKPSFEDFAWAFQLVNGRHWRVPFHHHEHHDESIETPPANTPTQSWVVHESTDDDTIDYTIKPFLAPVADLLNFGPPCTRVKTSHGFEVIATCEIPKGHEVTFWYSDLCADAVLAVYGMTSDLIGACKSALEWSKKAAVLERRLTDAVEDIEILEHELEQMESTLSDCCDSVDDHEDGGPSLRHGSTRSQRYVAFDETEEF